MTQDTEEYTVPFCEEDVEVLYQDDYLLLVNKPARLLSVPGRLPQNKDCMITRLQKDFPTATICHRLDMDTSGLLLVPLCKEVHADITRQFMRREIHKTYTAVVWGKVTENGSVDLPIVFDWDNRPRQKICHETGKPSLTHFEVLEHYPSSTRLLLKPITGRSHQLRIHCREMGHPILGDELYANADAIAAADRLLLHSTTFEFTHPITGKPILWRCEPPF
jgi:tRNA pseudouridine32 synthase/23S rRNA pseudouridine746 synthase